MPKNEMDSSNVLDVRQLPMPDAGAGALGLPLAEPVSDRQEPSADIVHQTAALARLGAHERPLQEVLVRRQSNDASRQLCRRVLKTPDQLR